MQIDNCNLSVNWGRCEHYFSVFMRSDNKSHVKGVNYRFS